MVDQCHCWRFKRCCVISLPFVYRLVLNLLPLQRHSGSSTVLLIRITLDHPQYLGGHISISDNFHVSLVYSQSNNYHVTLTQDMLQDSTSFHVMAPSILRKVSQLFGKNNDSSWPIQDISTDKHQSCDAFPSIPHNSPVGDIPTNILAFRTNKSGHS